MIDQELMAFWEHDRHPYLLCGTVTSFCSNGSVETIEYGSRRRFKPLFILIKEEGKLLKEELSIQETNLFNELNKVKNTYNYVLKRTLEARSLSFPKRLQNALEEAKLL